MTATSSAGSCICTVSTSAIGSARAHSAATSGGCTGSSARATTPVGTTQRASSAYVGGVAWAAVVSSRNSCSGLYVGQAAVISAPTHGTEADATCSISAPTSTSAGGGSGFGCPRGGGREDGQP